MSKEMKKHRFNFPIKMWTDIAAVTITLFAIGVAVHMVWVLFISVIIFAIALTGVIVSLYRFHKDIPLKDSSLSRDISMIATYVWPCILGGLIFEEYGYFGAPFFIFAFFITVGILIVNHMWKI